MFRNWLILASRNFFKHKTFSFINVSGLAISLACCILLAAYVQYELSYDQFHRNADDLYRVIASFTNDEGGLESMPVSPIPMAAALEENFSEVASTVRLSSTSVLLRANEKAFNEDAFYYADPDFLTAFDFPLVKGDPATALAEPYSVVVTEEVAQKFWGDEYPIGKSIRYGSIYDLTVTGVIKAAPANSSLQFDYLTPISTSLTYWNGEDNVGSYRWTYGRSKWATLALETYVLLKPGTDRRSFQAKFESWAAGLDADQRPFEFKLQPLTDIHLSGATSKSEPGNVDIRYVYLLATIALLILVIACANYMTLSTARSSARAREVGIRKVMGADRFGLLRQFMGESILFSLLALVLASGLARLALPYFGAFVHRDLTLDYFESPLIAGGLIGFAFLVGIVAGLYPALFLSSFRPSQVIKGDTIGGSGGGGWFRKAMVVGQYAISAALVICTFVVFQQMDFIKNQNLGYRSKNVVAVQFGPQGLTGSYTRLKDELLAQPGVIALASSESLPATGWGGANRVWWEGSDEEDRVYFAWTKGDYDFLDFYDIAIIAGRNFSPDMRTDRKSAVIVNETAVRAMGWTPKEAIGKEWGLSQRDARHIVGVFEDCHFTSMHTDIVPAAVMLNPGKSWCLSIQLADDNRSETIAAIGDTWDRYTPRPFAYTFVEDVIDSWYRAGQRLITVLTAGAMMAILIACLGLFGLASFTAERRVREIGVRKVLGASVSGIVGLLTKQFIVWVLMANVLAWPVAWYAMDQWLQRFAYRIELGWLPFAAAAVLGLLIAILTVASQTIGAARANPILALRYE